MPHGPFWAKADLSEGFQQSIPLVANGGVFIILHREGADLVLNSAFRYRCKNDADFGPRRTRAEPRKATAPDVVRRRANLSDRSGDQCVLFAIRGVIGLSPCRGASTTTIAPTFTRL